MKSIHQNEQLRLALYALYVSQFEVLKNFPSVFTMADATRMLTGMMGSRPWSWRVIGITDAALETFASNDFKRPTGAIQRGHRADRSSTAKVLFYDRDFPLGLEEFFAIFLERDQTILMTKEENKHRPGEHFPDFTVIDTSEELFPCSTLVGWQHRKAEVDFLRRLHIEKQASKDN